MTTDPNTTPNTSQPSVSAPTAVVVDAVGYARTEAEAALSPEIPTQADEPTVELDDSGVPIYDPATLEEEVLTEDEARASRLHSPEGSPPTDGDYGPALREPFASVFELARQSGDEAEVEAVREGKAQVLACLSEFGVGNVAARECAFVFAKYQAAPLDDDAIATANERCIEHLKAKHGPRWLSTLHHARTAFRAACQRAPWLKEAADLGAGSDPAVLEHFAAVGRRLARKGRS